MSAISSLLRQCDALGIKIALDIGGNLAVDAQEKVLTADIIERLRACKSDLVKLLEPCVCLASNNEDLESEVDFFDDIGGKWIIWTDSVGNEHWTREDRLADIQSTYSVPISEVGVCKCGQVNGWQNMLGEWRCSKCSPPVRFSACTIRK